MVEELSIICLTFDNRRPGCRKFVNLGSTKPQTDMLAFKTFGLLASSTLFIPIKRTYLGIRLGASIKKGESQAMQNTVDVRLSSFPIDN